MRRIGHVRWLRSLASGLVKPGRAAV